METSTRSDGGPGQPAGSSKNFTLVDLNLAGSCCLPEDEVLFRRRRCLCRVIPDELLIRVFVSMSGKELCHSLSPVCKKWASLITTSDELWKSLSYCKFLGTLEVLPGLTLGLQDCYRRFAEHQRLQNTTRKRRRDRSNKAQQASSLDTPQFSKEIGMGNQARITKSAENLRKIPGWKVFYFSMPYRAALLEPWMLDLEFLQPVSSTNGDIDSNENRNNSRIEDCESRIQDLLVCLRDMWITYDQVQKEEKTKIVELSFAAPRAHHVLLDIRSPRAWGDLDCRKPHRITILTNYNNTEAKTDGGRVMAPLYLIGYGESIRQFSDIVHKLRNAARQRCEQLRQRGDLKEALDYFMCQLPAAATIDLPVSSQTQTIFRRDFGSDTSYVWNPPPAWETSRYRCFLSDLLNHIVRRQRPADADEVITRQQHSRFASDLIFGRGESRSRVLPVPAPALVQQVLQEIDRSAAAQHEDSTQACFTDVRLSSNHS
eukprot:CAMPEP_0184480786 /NCGR_PEP_ID=MMETSP0113_2-20130426/2306_1 /TAXON_ID=91329 /ORGANISM="Norrisiella sphaerica, Strain BC52" /LENGTH=486 /DNA_ID=CAMNT_0026859505 /DNA_START=8 /DNA_END=1469 /DNA_ORIENTATION=+